MGARVNKAKLGKLLAGAVLLAALAAPLYAQDVPPPPPPPPPPPSGLPPITVPTPLTSVPPGTRCPAINPAPSLNPFAAILPAPAGVALAQTPPLTADFWMIGQEHLGSSASNLTQSQFTLAYDFRYPVGPVTLGARPQFDVMFLSGPTPPGPDLPPQVYGLSVAFEAEFRVDQRFSIRAAVQPGIFTDFNHVGGNAFRVPAQIVGSYGLSQEIALVGGVMYTAQPSLSVLPIAGVIWTPAQAWRFEFMFPQSRVIYHFEDGLNVYGVLGLQGETYSIRVLGTNDLLQYRDVRLGLGAEWDTRYRLALFFEAGLAFWRRLDLGDQGNNDVNSGLYLRVGGRF